MLCDARDPYIILQFVPNKNEVYAQKNIINIHIQNLYKVNEQSFYSEDQDEILDEDQNKEKDLRKDNNSERKKCESVL